MQAPIIWKGLYKKD